MTSKVVARAEWRINNRECSAIISGLAVELVLTIEGVGNEYAYLVALIPAQKRSILDVGTGVLLETRCENYVV